VRTGWIELAAIPAALLVVYLLRSNHWASEHVRRAWNWLKAWARLAPFTATLWLLVAVHAWMLIGLPRKVRDAVLLTHSTTLRHLQDEPLTVLFGSAMWTDVGELLFMTATAVIYLAPLERWIGTLRTVLAFLAGHIGATVLIAVWIEQTVVLTRQQQNTYNRTIDVGVSYGAYCCAALLAYRLRLPYRISVWALLLAYLLYQASLTDFDASVDYTSLGHLVAFGIGVLCWPLTRTSRARARRGDPWVRIPRSTSAFRTVERAKDNEPEVVSSEA
jgi:membrane associated rhomboid family serine protease